MFNKRTQICHFMYFILSHWCEPQKTMFGLLILLLRPSGAYSVPLEEPCDATDQTQGRRISRHALQSFIPSPWSLNKCFVNIINIHILWSRKARFFFQKEEISFRAELSKIIAFVGGNVEKQFPSLCLLNHVTNYALNFFSLSFQAL